MKSTSRSPSCIHILLCLDHRYIASICDLVALQLASVSFTALFIEASFMRRTYFPVYSCRSMRFDLFASVL